MTVDKMYPTCRIDISVSSFNWLRAQILDVNDIPNIRISVYSEPTNKEKTKFNYYCFLYTCAN